MKLNDYEFAMGRKFHHQISKIVNNKETKKQGRKVPPPWLLI
jgi:hypothetical protein